MALPANQWPFQSNFRIPLFKPIPTPASVRGGPVACIGGPVARDPKGLPDPPEIPKASRDPKGFQRSQGLDGNS